MRTWNENELIVEPGASHPETFEFIVSREVRAVLIDTYFYNQTYEGYSMKSKGWGATTAYDIIKVG